MQVKKEIICWKASGEKYFHVTRIFLRKHITKSNDAVFNMTQTITLPPEQRDALTDDQHTVMQSTHKQVVERAIDGQDIFYVK